MTDPTPQDPPNGEHDAAQDRDPEDRDPEERANEELLDPAGPTELGDAVDG